ncbi:MAG: hypothetical protein K2K01_02340 [Eubacterium sp.]|nr:hypothetical protein [Eubacterium sp.]
MSYENFEKALELAKTLPDYTIYDCCSDKTMDELEDYLGFELSKQHYELLRKGCLSYPGNFIVSNFKDSHTSGMDIIGHLEINKKYGLKVDAKFVPFIDEDEWRNYLNYNKLTPDGEPTVVYAMPSPDGFIIFEQTNQDLGDFLLELFNGINDNLE